MASRDTYHHGDLKATVLAQAAALVAERGADAVSLRELARAAGVSHAAPAHHFTDRRGLFTALATEGFGMLADALKGARPDFLDAALAYVRFALDHRTHTLANLRNDGRMMLEVIGDGFIYGVSGIARIVVDQMQHAPVPSALVQVDVETVKRDLPPGVEVTAPAFRWGALEGYMSSVEPLMFEELRSYADPD